MTVIVQKMELMLRPAAVREVRETAERMQCRNNLKELGLRAHAYHGRTHPSTPPRIFVRHVCGAILDQTVPGAPRFWKWANQPFCAMSVLPFGTAGDEVQIGGSCNHSIAIFGVAPAAPLHGTACLPPPGATCEVTPDGVFFHLPSPHQPFVEFHVNVRTDTPVGTRNGWVGGAAGPDFNAILFPTDPFPGQPKPFP